MTTETHGDSTVSETRRHTEKHGGSRPTGAASVPTSSTSGAASVPAPSTSLSTSGKRSRSAGTAEGRSVRLSTATGVVTVTEGRLRRDADIELPSCDHPERLRPLLTTASMLLAHVPASSGDKIAGAIRRWKSFLTFVGLHGTAADWRAVVAFIVVRCCPPVDSDVPEFVTKPVLPSTAAGDVDCCLRAARLNVGEMTPFDKAFSDFRVSALLHNIKARSPRLKSKKKPLLFSAVEAYWRRMKAIGTTAAIRDGFAAIVALIFGTRSKELVGLKTDDLDLVYVYNEKSDKMDRLALRLTFRDVKTRQSIFSTLDPFTVTSAHPLLMEAFTLFDDKVEFWPGATIFRSDNGQHNPLSRDWLDKIAKAIDPQTSPHCFRVGCATELWAAGVSLEDIMSIGRWESMGAILYIIGSLESQVSASDRMGKGKLCFESGNLHKRIGTSLDKRFAPDAPTAKWAKLLSILASEGEDPEWSD